MPGACPCWWSVRRYSSKVVICVLWVSVFASQASGEQVAPLATRGQPGTRVGADLALRPGWEGARPLPPQAVLEDFQPSLGRAQWVPRGGCEEQQGCVARLRRAPGLLGWGRGRTKPPGDSGVGWGGPAACPPPQGAQAGCPRGSGAVPTLPTNLDMCLFAFAPRGLETVLT